MKEKKDILILDTNSKFINNLDNSLKNNVNLITVQSMEEALIYSKENKKGEININPSIIIVGNGCQISPELEEKIKKEYPAFYNKDTLQVFLPVFCSNLLCDIFQSTNNKKPKTYICANLEEYPFNKNNNNLEKKLGFCMQHNIPLMNRTETNQELILKILKDYILKNCNLGENNINR